MGSSSGMGNIVMNICSSCQAANENRTQSTNNDTFWRLFVSIVYSDPSNQLSPGGTLCQSVGRRRLKQTTTPIARRLARDRPRPSRHNDAVVEVSMLVWPMHAFASLARKVGCCLLPVLLGAGSALVLLLVAGSPPQQAFA